MEKSKKKITLAMYLTRIILFVLLHVTAPVAFGGINFTVVDSGNDHSIGLKSDGTLWAWGSERFGQLGNNTITNTNTSTPIQIGADTNWTAISSGFYHTIALKSDGTLWGWGRNQYGQLGDNTITEFPIPNQIGGDGDWTTISTGNDHSIGLKSGGTLWAWGRNNYGQLGNGDLGNNTDAPVQIAAGSNWTGISAGGQHTIAIKSGGTLWAWGYNHKGQLGYATTGTNADTPGQIGTETDCGHFGWQ